MLNKDDVKKELEAFADTLTVIGGSYIRSAIRLAIDPMKETDAVPVIRCENCRHHENDSSSDSHWCFVWETFTDNHVYCSFAERRHDETD